MEADIEGSLKTLVDLLSDRYIIQQKCIERLEYGVAENRKVIRHLESRLQALKSQEVGSAALPPSTASNPPPAASSAKAQEREAQDRAERLVSQLKATSIKDRPSSSRPGPSGAAPSTSGRLSGPSRASSSRSIPPSASPAPPAAAEVPKVPRALLLPPEFRHRLKAFPSEVIDGITEARDHILDSAAEFLVRCDRSVPDPPPGLEYLKPLEWYSTPGLQKLESLALIEALRRVVAEAEASSRVRPEIFRLLEEALAAADCLPSKHELESGLLWLQRVVRAVGPPRPEDLAGWRARERWDPSLNEDPALWNARALDARGVPLTPSTAAPLGYRTDGELAALAKVQQQLQWTALQEEVESQFVTALAQASLEALAHPDLTRGDVETAAKLLRAATALSGSYRGIAAIAEEVQVPVYDDEGEPEGVETPTASTPGSAGRGGSGNAAARLSPSTPSSAASLGKRR